MENKLSKYLNIVIKKIVAKFDDNWFSVIGDINAPPYKGYANDSVFLSESEEIGHATHAHSFYELIVIAKDSCLINVNENIITLELGNCCILMPETPHSELNNYQADYVAIWITIQNAFLTVHLLSNFDGKFDITDYYKFATEIIDYNYFIANISNKKQSNEMFEIELAKTYVLQALIHILKEVNTLSDTKTCTHSTKIVDQVIYYIDKNRDKEISLRNIAQYIGINVNHLNVIFKATTGTTISQYIINKRVSRAKNMLIMTPEKKISEIANILGFYDPYHFSKTFKKKVGVTPTEFRNIKMNE